MNYLIIFAKKPEKGKVKTRLSKDLGEDNTLRLYESFLKDIVGEITNNIFGIKRFLCITGDNDNYFEENFYKSNIDIIEQRGKGLGDRMYNAMEEIKRIHLKEGYSKKEKINIIIIGTDCISLNKEDIILAFDKLRQYTNIIGPCDDGGYYLIGKQINLKQENKKKIFENIKWSSEEVLKQTINNIKQENETYFLLRQQKDIDTIEEFKDLKKQINKYEGIKNTKRILKTINIEEG